MSDTDSWTPDGGGLWAAGRCRFSWSLRDVTAVGHLMNSSNTCILLVTKAKMLERDRFAKLLWIQYTEARIDGKVYTPAPTGADPHPWPWIGIDRYPNTIHRKDVFPYVSLPSEQERVDWGHAYEGRIKGLYDNRDADSVDVDWASSSVPGWGHYSVLTLIGRGQGGHEWSIGSLGWRWSLSREGQVSFGARVATPADVNVWTQCMLANYSQYMRETFQGAWPTE